MTQATEFDLKLAKWREISGQIRALGEQEMALRKELFGEAFATPVEGTNTLELAAGWKLKGVYKINRKVDETALPAIREKLASVGVSVDPLIKWSPDLEIRAYRAMSDATKSIFDQCLIIKPGAPALELVPPAAKKV